MRSFLLMLFVLTFTCTSLMAQQNTVSRVLTTKPGYAGGAGKPVEVDITVMSKDSVSLYIHFGDVSGTYIVKDLTVSSLHAYVCDKLSDSSITNIFDPGYIDRLDEMVILSHLIMTTVDADHPNNRSTFAFKDSIKLYYTLSDKDTGKIHFDYASIQKYGSVANVAVPVNTSFNNNYQSETYLKTVVDLNLMNTLKEGVKNTGVGKDSITNAFNKTFELSGVVKPNLFSDVLTDDFRNKNSADDIVNALKSAYVSSVVASQTEIYAQKKQDLQSSSFYLKKSTDSLNDILTDNRFKVTRLQVTGADDNALKTIRDKIRADSTQQAQNNALVAINDEQVAYLNSRLAVIAPQKQVVDTIDDLGHKFLSKSSYIKGKNIEIGVLYIDSLVMVIDDGFIKSLKVTLSDSMRFHNNYGGEKVPINLCGFNKEQYYNVSLDLRSVTNAETQLQRIFRISTYKLNAPSLNYWIQLSQLVHYDPPHDSTLIDLFVPQRQRIFYTKNGTRTTVPEESINYVFKVNLFSDLVGTQQDQPNGLIQLEASLFANLQSRRSPKRYRNMQWRAFDHLEVKMRVAKIEQKLKDLQLYQQQTPTDTFLYAYNFQLWQYANLEFQTKLNIFTWGDYAKEFKMYVGVGFLRTTVTDSNVVISDNTRTITPMETNAISSRFMTSLSYKVKMGSNFGTELIAEGSVIKLLDNSIKQSSGFYDSRKPGGAYVPYKAFQNIIFSPQVLAYYHATRDENQRVYFRAILNKDLGSRGNVFYNLQIGYSSDINKFLNFKNN